MVPIQYWQTGNGVRVYYVPTENLPMVDLRLVFDAGSARGEAFPGLARLTNRLLDEGAGIWSATELAEQFEDVGAVLSTGALRDMAWVALRSLTDPPLLQQAVSAFSAVVASPTFPEEAFERERRRMMVELRQTEQSPGGLAEIAFYREVFGDHPYSQSPKGSEDSLSRLSLADVRDFHRRFYVGRNAILVIVGALERKEAERFAEQVTAGLAVGERSAPLPAVRGLAEASTVTIHHPSQQTHVMIGQPGMRSGDPDYFPLYVGNHILGGDGLISRLAESIREREGLSYSVSSYLVPMESKGPFIMEMQTKNTRASEGIELMRKTLQRFLSEGPSEQELESAKSYIIGSFPLRLDSNGKIVGNVANLGFYGLPPNYLETFTEKVAAVTREQIRSAMQRRLSADRMVTVVVGDGEMALATLADEERDKRGALGQAAGWRPVAPHFSNAAAPAK
jgi:zinc protease